MSSSLGTKDKQIGDLVNTSAKVMAAYASQSRNLGNILDDLNTLGAKLAGINDVDVGAAAGTRGMLDGPRGGCATGLVVVEA